MGRELEISGDFIYESAVRMNQLSYVGNHFELNAILYNGSVGIERLQKIILCMYMTLDDLKNPKKCLREHHHTALNEEIQKYVKIDFNKNALSVLALFEKYYGEFRYAEYRLNYDENEMCQAFISFINKHIGIQLSLSEGNTETDNKKMKSFYINLIGEIALKYYAEIRKKADELNLFTYEMDSSSNAIKVFYRTDKSKLYDKISIENYAFKELVIFLTKTKCKTNYINYLKGVEPLSFDKLMLPEYLRELSTYKPSDILVDAVDDMYTNIEKAELQERKEYLNLMSENVLWDQ